MKKTANKNEKTYQVKYYKEGWVSCTKSTYYRYPKYSRRWGTISTPWVYE